MISEWRSTTSGISPRKTPIFFHRSQNCYLPALYTKRVRNSYSNKGMGRAEGLHPRQNLRMICSSKLGVHFNPTNIWDCSSSGTAYLGLAKKIWDLSRGYWNLTFLIRAIDENESRKLYFDYRFLIPTSFVLNSNLDNCDLTWFFFDWLAKYIFGLLVDVLFHKSSLGNSKTFNKF